MYDAVVVGAGPNGLAAAVELARSGLRVLLREAQPEVGGAARTRELTLPGFRHDVGSAVHPLGVGSPFFRSLPLERHGLEWIHPEIPLAHPLDGGRAVALRRSVHHTAAALEADGPAYRRLVDPFVRAWPTFADHIFTTPMRPPRAPFLMGRFGLSALRGAEGLARARFRTGEARALLGGNAAHSGLPLERAPSAAIGLVLLVAGHAVGWPFPRGGAGALTRALARHFESLGGTIELDAPVASLGELRDARAVVLDLTPRQILEVCGDDLPPRYRAALERWTYGPAAFKVDWALGAPIPWTAEACRLAGTVHVGGPLEEIAASERYAWEGRGVHPHPFVLLSQPSVFDDTRAPAGAHTAWAYCHAPIGWQGDATELIEAQIERFAPGFRATVRARRAHTPAELQAFDANLVGGDINGGAATLRQMFARPVLSLTPWATPLKDVYVCSASTSPGGGVHGMCGYHAARTALERTFGR